MRTEAPGSDTVHGGPTGNRRVLLAAFGAFGLAFAVALGLQQSASAPPSEPERQSVATTSSESPERTTPASSTGPEQQPAQKEPDQKQPKPSRRTLSADEIFARVSPAVVQVVIQDQFGNSTGSASGFVVSKKGLVATNYHVIKRAHAASVVLPDKTKLSVTGVAAMDDEADIAIVRVSAQFSAAPLTLAGEDLPPIGTRVYAIGNPRGFTRTLSDGLVSGHREAGTLAKTLRIPMIQTTAPISPGSSGGPLVSQNGKVIGVTTAGWRDGQNLNFAVPAFHVTRLLRQCESSEEVKHLPLVQQSVAEERDPPKPVSQLGARVQLTYEQQQKCSIRIRQVSANASSVEGIIYNGTNDVAITKVNLLLRTDVWKREYAVTVTVRPLSSQSFSINIPDSNLWIRNFTIQSVTGVTVGR